MPKPVNDTALKNISDVEEKSTQEVKSVTFEDQAFFYKHPPAALVDATARRLRIMNEAVCGAVVEKVNEALSGKFITPRHLLVINSKGQLVGILSQKVSYESLADRGTGRKNLLDVLHLSGFPQISTLRYFLADPDGYNNVGYGSKGLLSSIDYGLANFDYLSQEKALLSTEEEHLPSERGLAVFELKAETVLTGILEPLEEVEFLTNHVFSGFNKDMTAFCQDNQTEVQQFFRDVNATFKQIALVFSKPTFKSDIIEALGIKDLLLEDQALFECVFKALTTRAQALKTCNNQLRSCTPQELEIMATLKVGRDSPLPPLLSRVYSDKGQPQQRRRSSSTAKINAVIAASMEVDQRQPQSFSGKLSPAQGGGVGGNPKILIPISLRAWSLDKKQQGSPKPPATQGSPKEPVKLSAIPQLKYGKPSST